MKDSQKQQTLEQSQKSESIPKLQEITFHYARDVLRQFVQERDWYKFHTPRNLILTMVGQIGELAQIFRWKGEVKSGLPDFSQVQKRNVSEELADVLYSLIRLADQCGIDLGQAFLNKMAKNRQKYPKDLAKGSDKKYTEYSKTQNNSE